MATRRRPTIHDVAQLAGVSPTTVSHALNDKGRVEAATRERVRRVAEELGYQANRVARGLRSGQTWTLGLMLPHGPAVAGTEDFFGIDFYLDLAVGMAQAAFSQRHGLTLLPDVATRDELGQFPLDGVIVNDPLSGDPRLIALDELQLPYVTVERALDRPEHTRWVACDTIVGTRSALDHLAELGAERIALLTLDLPWAWLADTETAYRAWCADRRREPIVVDVSGANRDGSRLPTVGEAAIAAIGAADGIFTASDRYAVSVARALLAGGRLVGKDVLLACGVDSRYAQEHPTPITALDLRPRALAEAAVELLLSGEGAPRLLAPELRLRASSLGPRSGTRPGPS